jgi:hypothetical protein
MKTIFSKQCRYKRKKFKKYWRVLEPKKYVDLMISNKESIFLKIAGQELKEVELFGILKQSKNGFVYLDISNNVIHGLFTMIDEEGIEKPPYFDKDGVGCHISVISEEEIKDKKIKEIGEKFKFKLDKMYSVKPDTWEEMERVWFISLKAPRLSDLRKKYDLPATYKDKGEDFHISVAVKRK